MTQSKELDLALWGCFAEFIEESPVTPLPVSSLTHTSIPAEAAFICEGFPGAGHTEIPASREMYSKSSNILGRRKQPAFPLDPSRYFAFDYGTDENPSGMSGSPVWNLNLHLVDTFKDWRPDLSSFAGVVTRWCPESDSLVATRVEAVHEFLTEAVPQLRARWAQESESSTQK